MIMPSQAGGVRTHRKRRRQYPGSVKAAALEADDVEITIIFRVLGAGEIEEVGWPNVRAPLAQSGLIRSLGKPLDCAPVFNSQK
jgi:hypothetical protein